MKKNYWLRWVNDYERLTGVEFICSFFKKLSEHEITLLHNYRRDASDMNKAPMDLWPNPDDKVEGILTVGARKALDKASALLSQSHSRRISFNPHR